MTDHREIEQLVETVRDRLRAGQRVAVNDPRRRYRADYFTDALEAADRLATIAKTAEERARELTDHYQRRLSDAEAARAAEREARERAEAERDGLFKIMQAERPPDEVFRFFQRLHGLPEVGAPKSEAEARAARAEEALREARQAAECEQEHGGCDCRSCAALSDSGATKRDQCAYCADHGDSGSGRLLAIHEGCWRAFVEMKEHADVEAETAREQLRDLRAKWEDRLAQDEGEGA